MYVSVDKVKTVGAISAGMAMGGIRLSMAISSCLFVISILCLLYCLWADDFKIVRNSSKYLWLPVVVFAVSLIPAYFGSEDYLTATRFYANTFLYRPFAFFVFVYMLFDRPELVKKSLLIVFVLFSVEALYSYYTIFFGIERQAVGFNSNSPISPFTTCICVYMVPCIVMMLEDSLPSIYRRTGIAGFVFCLIALIANDCRTGFLTAAILMVILGGYQVVRSPKKLIVSLVACVLIGGFFCVHPHYRQRVLSISNTTTNTSNLARLYLWEDAVRIWKDNVVVGIGLCSWPEVYPKQYFSGSKVKTISKQPYIHTHSNYFQLLAETGIIGLGGYLFMMGSLLLYNLKRLYRKHNPFYLACIGTILAYGCCATFDYIIYFPTSTRTFWFMLGAMAVMGQWYEREKKKCE